MQASTVPSRMLVVLAVVMVIGGGCIQKPTAEIRDIEVVAIDFRKIDLAFHLGIHNPNKFDIRLSALTYDLSTGDSVFARGSLPGPLLSLAAGETVSVAAPVTLEYKGLADAFAGLGSGESVPYAFNSSATFNWLIFPIPLKVGHTGSIPRLKKPGWHFRDVKFVRGAPSWLALSFEVDNPNAFELPLKRLHGAIKYGDDIVVRVDEPALDPIPAAGSGMFNVRVRADGPGVTKAITGALLSGERKRFSFEGDLRLGVPDVLRTMLLGKAGND